MPLFLDKSKQSKTAAELLAKEGLFSSCINRAYYNCVQHLLHVLYEKLNYDNGKYYANKKDYEGSHSYVSRIIGDELYKKSHSDYKWYQVKIKEFKLLRVKADYYPDIITSDEGNDSLKRSEAIINCVNTIVK